MYLKKISFKLFAITSFLLILFLSIVLILQSMFLENFYIKQKTQSLETNFEQFKKTLTPANMEDKSMLSGMQEFSEKNNAKLAILILTDSKIHRLMNSEGQNSPSSQMDVTDAIIHEWISLPTYYDAVLKDRKTVSYSSQIEFYNINYLVIASQAFQTNKGEKVVLFMVSSMQPVGQAVSIIKKYYIYVYVGAVLLILLLSLLYSSMISKPLRNIHKTAMKMADFDFKERCEITSQDELGSLAHTLNFLAEKLDTTLSELNTANEMLTKDLEHKNRLELMRKDFIAGVSHELKTPITLIESYAEGLKYGIAQGEDKNYYTDVILEEAEKMGLMVNEMLELSRLESGQYKLDCENMDMIAFISKILKKYSNRIEKKDLKLLIDLSFVSITVHADAYRLEQALGNILNNAIRHTPAGGSLKVRVLQNGSNCLVQIENEGEQIDENELENIWEKFYKLDKSRNRDLGGTGLGLNIVKSILQLHGARFGAINTDQGVKFFFELPIV